MQNNQRGSRGPRLGLPKIHKLFARLPHRAELARLARQLRPMQAVVFRVRIIIEGVGGLSNVAMAGKLCTTGSPVGL